MSWTKRQGIMLCQPMDDHNLARNWKDSPILLAQPKLDGQRAWVDWQENEPILVSSQGHPITGVPHIGLALKMLAIYGQPLAFDGELYCHRLPFEEIVSRTKRLPGNRHPDFTSVEYHIFDYKSSEPNGERFITLDRMFARWDEEAPAGWKDCMQMVRTDRITSNQELEERLNTYVADGYEGIIVRNPLAGYVEKRPYTILKWKPSKEDFYRVEKVVEAKSEDGKPLGQVGSLVCTDRHGNRFAVGCGIGLTTERKESLWAGRSGLVGQFARVQYQNLTQKGVPRFGKFTLVVSPGEINGEEVSW